jgi:RNA polymerase sigma-70 factor (ECF subfamily)
MLTFEEVFEQYFDAVLKVAWRAAGRRDLAEDFVADAFLALHRQFHDIDQRQLPAWLFTAVRNRAIDYWRHVQVERRYVAALARDASSPKATTPMGFESLLSPSLSPAHRLCLVLRFVHGMSRAEIAGRTGYSENQVRGLLQYALSLLRKEIVRSP